MKIIYFGSGKFGIKCLDAIKKSRHQLLHIYTQPAQRAGRGKKLKPTDVAVWAERNKVKCCQCSDVNRPETIEEIRNHQADLLVVIAFGQKISGQLVSSFPKGAVNVHASLLPAYRGAAPVNWAIINGDTKTGVSIITLADKMDAGEVLAQGQVAIEQTDTADVVLDKLADISPGVLMGAIDDIEMTGQFIHRRIMTGQQRLRN